MQDVATEGASASTEAALTQLTVTDSTKSAVLQTTQSATYFVATATGMLFYNPNGTVLDGNDFSNFLVAAHKNSAVTGQQFKVPIRAAKENMLAICRQPMMLVNDCGDTAKCDCACHLTGVQLASGSYRVLPFSTSGHIYMSCSGQTAAFEVDITGSALYFTVRNKLFTGQMTDLLRFCSHVSC